MDNLLAVIIIILCVGWALYYIISEKKKGIKCIGCPLASTCHKNKCSKS